VTIKNYQASKNKIINYFDENLAGRTVKPSDIFLESAKDLLDKMLNIQPEARPTAEDILKHKWFDGLTMTTAINIVRQALQAPFIKILSNAGVENWWEFTPSELVENKIYDAKNHKMVNAFEAGIIDPAKVVITAVKNAASVAGTILTTESVIFEKAEKNEAPANPMANMM
jgi:serine/threonine protein kinase